MKSNRGMVLFETVLALFLLSGVLFAWHVRIAREWRERLSAWEGRRLRYDGEVLWKR